MIFSHQVKPMKHKHFPASCGVPAGTKQINVNLLLIRVLVKDEQKDCQYYFDYFY